METGKIRLLVVDDHELVRFGLQAALIRVPDLTVVGAVADGESAVQQALSLKPDVVLMDIGLPRMDGIEASKQIKQSCAEIRILMLTSYEKEHDVLAAFAAGADGYCLKTVALENLANAIRSVNQGAAWLDPAIADRVLRAFPPTPKAVTNASKRMALSQRESEVLVLLVEGLTNIQIAQRLNVSNETAKSHVRHIMEKLAVSDRTQAAVKALREGLIDN